MSEGAVRAAVRSAVQERLLGGADSEDPFIRRLQVREEVTRALGAHAVRDRASLVREVTDEIAGLGPLEPLLRDPLVTEVMVNSSDEVWIERSGRLQRTDVRFEGPADVRHLIERIVAPLGLRVDDRAPWVDARLDDGSRVHAILPPLAVRGPTLTIRRVPSTVMTLADLVERGSIDEGRAWRLAEAVRRRTSMLISGGAGAGKTTLLRALAAEIPEGERVITIEDTAELGLKRDHVVALETRPTNVEGTGAVTIRDLVRNALRMRPDRIVVGEVRGPEVLDMLQAMNTGHEGSMSTVHANSAADVVARLESMALLGGGMGAEALRRQLASAISLVIQVGRRPDGIRVVDEICRVVPDGDQVSVIPWA